MLKNKIKYIQDDNDDGNRGGGRRRFNDRRRRGGDRDRPPRDGNERVKFNT